MEEKKNGVGFGVASMVCGIIALLVGCCLGPIGIVLAIIAVVLGAVSIKKNSGKGMGIAGLVCGIISLVPSVLAAVSGAALMSELGSLGSMF